MTHHHPRGRALDWTCAFMVLSWGVVLLLPGDTLASTPAYAFLADIMPRDAAWALVFLSIGGLRAAALIINGHWPEGSPILRGAAAALGVVVWTLLVAGFLDLSLSRGAAQAGLGIYTVLLGADLFSCARAGADSVRARRAGHAKFHRV